MSTAGILLWTYRAGKQPAKLWIPASQRELAFKFAHCQTHPGKRETKRLFKERYFWKGLPADIEQFYKRCPICCQENSRRPCLALRPFQVPSSSSMTGKTPDTSMRSRWSIGGLVI